jgi:rhodanese-related sulfurtransferase
MRWVPEMMNWWRIAFIAILVSVAGGRTAASTELLNPLAANELVSSSKLTMVDVRTAEERAVHGIPQGSIWIEWRGVTHGQLFIDALTAAQPDKSAPVAFICSVGHRSGQAARLVERSGYRQVFDIAEGVNGSMLGPGWKLWGLAMQR